MIKRTALTILVCMLASVPALAGQVMTFDLKAAPAPEKAINTRPSANIAQAVFVSDGSIKLDGSLSDWPKGIEPMKAVGTSDPGDLSAVGYIAVSPTSLYLAFDVTDDKQEQRDAGLNMWRFDSIQFALDPLTQKTPGRYGDYDHEIGLCFRDNEPLVYRWQKPAGMKGEEVPGAVMGVKFREGGVVYEAKIPLSELWPLRPEVGSCGFSWLVNDSDGGDRESFAAWSSGIGSGKDASQFGEMHFPADLTKNCPVASRCITPKNPTPSTEPQKWELEVFAPSAGNVTVKCDGVVEHGQYKGSPVQGVTTLNVPAGVSKWVLSADLSQFAPARLGVKVSVTDTAAAHKSVVYVYKPSK